TYTQFVNVWANSGGQPARNIHVQQIGPGAPTISRNDRLLAVIDQDDPRVWDLVADRELWRKPDPVRIATAVAFAPDGRTLAVSYDDCTILLWTLPRPQKGKPIPAAERVTVWELLASTDAGAAFAAQWRLVDDPDTALPLLRERLLPVAPAA